MSAINVSGVALHESYTRQFISPSDSHIDEQISSVNSSEGPLENDLRLYRLNSLVHISPVERDLFRFYRLHMADYFADSWQDSMFWRLIVPQASIHDPVVLHAVLAFASLRRRRVSSLGGDTVIKMKWTAFELTHCNAAIVAFCALNEPQVKERIDLVAIVAILFACISCAVGEGQNILNHIEHSIKLFRIHSPLFLPSSPYGKASAFSRGVRATLQRYELCCTLVSGRSLRSALSLQPITTQDDFETPDQARTVLNHVLYRVIYLLQPPSSESSAKSDKVSLVIEMCQILKVLDRWDVLFAQLREAYTPTSQTQQFGMHILQVQASAARIMVTPASPAGVDRLVLQLHEQVIMIPGSLDNVKNQLPYSSGLVAVLTIIKHCVDLPNLSTPSKALLQDMILLIRLPKNVII